MAYWSWAYYLVPLRMEKQRRGLGLKGWRSQKARFLFTMFLLWGVAAQNPACPTNPSDTSCSSFTLPPSNSTALYTDLCTQMSGMPACSLKATCPSQASYCSPFSLYATACMDMPTMSSCSSFTKLCGANPKSAVNPQCQSSFAVLPTTEKST